MLTPDWLTQRLIDVPPHDGWLGERERRVLADLSSEPRRVTWRLGRWTAKRLAAAALDIPLERLEVLAASDGAPEVWLGGGRAPVSLSLSHRGDRGLAVVMRTPGLVGCDLELIEPRSQAFEREWLASAEQRQVRAAASEHVPLLANLLWTGKEAAAKLRREGLRLNVRQLVVTPGVACDGWAPLTIWDGGEGLHGWWRADADYVMTVVCDPASTRPGDEMHIDEPLEREALGRSG